MSALRTSLVVARFDLSRELRRPIASAAVLLFGVCALVVLRLALAGGAKPGDAVLAGAIWIVLVFAALAGAFYLGVMGGGDVKMAPAVLLWFPAARALDFLMIMSLAGGLVTLVALARHRAGRREGRPEVPYGVAIAAAGLWLIAERYFYQFG